MGTLLEAHLVGLSLAYIYFILSNQINSINAAAAKILASLIHPLRLLSNIWFTVHSSKKKAYGRFLLQIGKHC